MFSYGHNGLPWGLSGKEAICNAGYVGSVPWGKNWQLTPVFLCVENPMNREAWYATGHGISEMDTT